MRKPSLRIWSTWRRFGNLIFDRRVTVPGRDLIDTIDDYAVKLTGDRTALHSKSSRIV